MFLNSRLLWQTNKQTQGVSRRTDAFYLRWHAREFLRRDEKQSSTMIYLCFSLSFDDEVLSVFVCVCVCVCVWNSTLGEEPSERDMRNAGVLITIASHFDLVTIECDVSVDREYRCTVGSHGS
jgi:hypothetical protein